MHIFSYNVLTIGVRMLAPTCDSMIRLRIDSKTKEKAVQVLDKICLTVSDAVCMFLVRIAEGDVFPLILKRLTPKL
ncbi:MAG: type II toxin-antitoxin system RelB/DinJ family antitoxin [Acetomicrobium sp.]